VRLSRLTVRSLCLYWKSSVTIALGVAIATAIIAGSLILGDSVKASVRQTALARLGQVDHALSAPHFFRAALAEDIQARFDAEHKPGKIAAVTIADATARNVQTEATIPNLTVVGINACFRKMFPAFDFELTSRNAAVNATAARDLGISEGDAVLVHVRRNAAEPAGSMFARRERHNMLASMRLIVRLIVPDAAGGAFSLSQQTAAPRNLFVAADWLNAQLNAQTMATTILAAGSDSADLQQALAELAQPVDYGLKVQANAQHGYLSIQSNRLVLAAAQIQALRNAAAANNAAAAVTSVYLADKIRAPNGLTSSYALLAGAEGLNDFAAIEGTSVISSDSQILLNSWLAEDLAAVVGDVLSIEYLIAMADGQYILQTQDFTVQGIVEIAGSAVDPQLVPEFHGITEAAAVSDWNPPFPVDMARVSERDDLYWQQYRTTPKAFVSAAAVRKMWQRNDSAAPWVTSLRILPAAATALSELSEVFPDSLREHLPPTAAGLLFRPVRQLAVAAAAGSQDFGMLFTSMGVFIVVAALGLAAMLMRLSVQQRAAQVGTLLACGFTPAAAVRAATAEGCCLAAVGALVGLPLGIAYATAMLAVLTSNWFGTIGEAAMKLHISFGWLVLGGSAGLAAGCVSTHIGARSMKRASVLELLAGWQAMNLRAKNTPQLLARRLLLATVLIAGFAPLLAAGTFAFFVTGSALLIAGLCAAYLYLGHCSPKAGARLTRASMARRAAALNTARSMLAIGLLASAAFIIISVAAFTRNYSAINPSLRHSGTGGFALRATATIPIAYDPSTATGRQHLGFSADDQAIFADVRLYSLLANTGDDISCLNLAKPDTPRLLGVCDAFIDRGGFNIRTHHATADPWQALHLDLPAGSIAVFGDADSILWQLNSRLGEHLAITSATGETFQLYIAGMISNSIFAGELLMSEANFRRLYPAEDRPRYFLIEADAAKTPAVAQALRRNLGDMGLDVTDTRAILHAVAGVQNTYILTFIALGGLGVMLGTFGLAVVLLRNALERRGEFALMLALGFSRKSLAAMLLRENYFLLFAGLAIGIIAALPAVLPQMRQTDFQINWLMLATVIACIAAAGLLSCYAAARYIVSGNLIQALREE